MNQSENIGKKNLYENSKIYKLIDNDNQYFYIGATTTSLSKRFWQHKEKALKVPDRKVYKYFNTIGWENVKIILISEHNLENIEQLRREEDNVIKKHINDENCLNSVHAIFNLEKHKEKEKIYQQINRDKILERKKNYREKNRDIISKYNQDHKEDYKKWVEENKEILKIKWHQYYEKNKDTINEKRRSIRITCICGSNLAKDAMLAHLNTNKHQTLLLNKQQQESEAV